MKIQRISKRLGWLIVILISFSCSEVESGTTYYFDAENGNDHGAGTSPDRAWKSLNKIQEVQWKPGDRILLKSGAEFHESIQLSNTAGTPNKPIYIGIYGGIEKAKLHFSGANGVLIENSSHITVQNLEIEGDIFDYHAKEESKMRCGVLITSTLAGSYENIRLSNLEVSNLFFESIGFERPKGEVHTPNGTQSYGWGIRVINSLTNAQIADISIDSVSVRNVSHTGIKVTAHRDGNDFGVTNLNISNCTVSETGGPGMQFSGVREAHIHHNTVDHSGSKDDPRKWGRGSGLWTWSSERFLIEHNRFTNANGPGDSAGAHIDYNCSNVVLQYNFSANNAGGFCEILGNNYNCAYRYNISVNDGYRKKGVDGAFQEGKIFWLSGYCGKERKGPYNSYFYNNSIFVSDSIQAKIAVDRLAQGILIANNIFHIEGKSQQVPGDQYSPETDGAWRVSNVFFQSNLFLTNESWPQDHRLQDEAPVLGNAMFKNGGGWAIEDYRPSNTELIKDRGSVIPKLQGDSTGIVYKLTHDILGNQIVREPDIGAIEIQL